MPAITRRQFLHNTALALPALAATTAQAQDRPPNIVLIMTDDQHLNTLGCYGGNVLTPHIDGLARDGMRFTRAYAISSVCVPSRYATLTGRYPGRCEHSDYLSQFPPGTLGRISNNCISLERNDQNLQSQLRAQGYATGMVGKWHLGPQIQKQLYTSPESFGFQTFDPDSDPESPAIAKALQHNHERACEIVRDTGFDYADGIYWANLKEVNNAHLNYHNIDWTVDAACDFMDQYHEQPFFLYFSTTMHHGPPPQQSVFGSDRITGEGIAPRRFDMMPTRESIKTRLKDAGLSQDTAYCTWLDDGVGALLDKLDKLSVTDNTLVVYTSDHGTDLKSSLYEGGVHVPMIARWPGHIQPGTQCDTLVQNIDFAPTFLNITNASVDMPSDGMDIHPLFTGGQLSRDALYFEIGYARAVCTQQWKYIAVRYPDNINQQLQSGKLKQPPNYIGLKGISERAQKNPHYFEADQLFNIPDDPTEQQNLAGNPKYAGVLKEMQSRLTQYLQDFPNRPFGEFT